MSLEWVRPPTYMQELFGPLSMRALEEDKYVRQIEGYLPYAKVAFIDEIFKANSAILNTLLTILNERLFDNGSSRIRVPLICLVSGQQTPVSSFHPLIRRAGHEVCTCGVAGNPVGRQVPM